MTPKEKADELIINFFRIQDDVINHEITWHEAKQCALVAVDEIIKNIINTPADYGASCTYWQEVKKELQNKLHI